MHVSGCTMKEICDTAWLRLEIRKMSGASAGGLISGGAFDAGSESEIHLWLDCKKHNVGDRVP